MDNYAFETSALQGIELDEDGFTVAMPQSCVPSVFLRLGPDLLFLMRSHVGNWE